MTVGLEVMGMILQAYSPVPIETELVIVFQVGGSVAKTGSLNGL